MDGAALEGMAENKIGLSWNVDNRDIPWQNCVRCDRDTCRIIEAAFAPVAA